MSSPLRREVLKAFKNVHRASIQVFGEDHQAITVTRNKINEEFKKNKHISESSSVDEMVKFANEVAEELKRSIVQAKEVSPGVFQLRLTKDTYMLDNKEFDPSVEIPPHKRKEIRAQMGCTCVDEEEKPSTGKSS